MLRKQYAKFDVCGSFVFTDANPLVSYPQHPKLLKLELPLQHITAYHTIQWWLAPGAAALSVLLSTALSTTPAFLQ